MTYSPEFLTVADALRANEAGAAARLDALARAGDPDALMMLGEYNLLGVGMPRNFAKGYKLVERAAQRGQEQARRTLAYLANRGIGRKANPKLARSLLARLAKVDRFAAVQNGLLEHLECRERVKAIEPQVISEDPYVAIWRGLFNKAEYGYLKHIGAPTMRPAMIANPATGEGKLDPIRRSDTTAIPMIEHDLIVHEIVSTIAEATGTHVEQGESLSLLRYGPGQEYKLHYDSYDENWPAPQRIYTALIWLNDGYEGGETRFPDIGLTVRGVAGDMLVFGNLGPDGKRDKRMRHAGLPVTRGEKWLATRWISVANRLEMVNDG